MKRPLRLHSVIAPLFVSNKQSDLRGDRRAEAASCCAQACFPRWRKPNSAFGCRHMGTSDHSSPPRQWELVEKVVGETDRHASPCCSSRRSARSTPTSSCLGSQGCYGRSSKSRVRLTLWAREMHEPWESPRRKKPERSCDAPGGVSVTDSRLRSLSDQSVVRRGPRK